jgi:hypothetical protein
MFSTTEFRNVSHPRLLSRNINFEAYRIVVLNVYETWFLSLREEHKIGGDIFRNGLLRKRKEQDGREHCIMRSFIFVLFTKHYCNESVKEDGLAGRVARTGEITNSFTIIGGKFSERDQLRELRWKDDIIIL